MRRQVQTKRKKYNRETEVGNKREQTRTNTVRKKIKQSINNTIDKNKTNKEIQKQQNKK